MPASFASLAARQTWLEPLEVRLQSAVRRGLENLGPNHERIEAFLHGEQLGHPLHVMLTDVPLGSWTTAMVCDAIGAFSREDRWDTAAQTAIGVGLAGALGAAVAGLADWSRLAGANRRIGLIHGLINIAGVAAFAGSRARRRRNSGGRLLSLGGYALAMLSARLGGYLVYQARVGVQPAKEEPLPWREVA